MKYICLDFETFYSKDFSLSKITTEQYIRDKQFQVIGFGYKINDGEPVWVSGDDADIELALRELDIENSYLIAHNAAFDGAILSMRYGIIPKYYLDTLSMARPITGQTVGGSLEKLAKKFALGEKGKEVIAALGKRREDFTPADLAQYGEYCKNDVQLTWNLYHVLRQYNPPKELFIQDLMIRMFTDPVLELDKVVLEDHLTNVQLKKKKLMDRIDSSIGRDALMSNPKFAEVLTKLGVTPPTKISLRTQKETYAFGKTDQDFKALLEHPNPAVQAVVAARLGIKSTLEETRTESFLGIAERGPLPILLNYWGAHTGRASGGDKMNLQNLPRGGALRKSIVAPKGHKLIAVDSSQIEARVVAWFAGQADLVEDFRNNVDIYSKFASYVYGRPIDRKRKEIDPATGKKFNPDKVEGFVGKTCLAEGTLVLCDSGWKPIEQVTTQDQLWDGEEWVCHKGLVNNGIKPTLNLSGLWLTPDHQVWSGMQWVEAQSVAQEPSIHYQALATAAANLPSQATYGASGQGYQRSSSVVTAMGLITPWIGRTSKPSRAPAAQYAPRLLVLQNGIGCIQTQWPTTLTGHDFSIDWRLPSRVATPPQTGPILIMGGAAYQLPSNGEMIERAFSDTCKRWMAGIVRSLKWIGSTSTETTNPETSASSPAATTCATNDALLTSRRNLQVYDLACAGPRHRFTVLTEDGPLIVHNCILGLGYGMGWEKFRGTLKIGMGGISVDFEEDQAKNTVNIYRSKYAHIADSWKQASGVLDKMARGFETELGSRLPLRCTPEGIHLPNHTMIRYANLRFDAAEKQYIYDGRYGAVKIYGGKIIENVVQALARIVVFDQMAKIDQHLRRLDGTNGERYKVVLTVHDEVVAVVPEHYAQTALDFMVKTMSTPPSWAADLPVACEGDVGDSYGDAK